MLGVTRKTGYGLIALTHLARVRGEALCSAREIAEGHDVPVSLLMNVMKELASAGLVESVRGSRGGYRLACDPHAVTVMDLVVVLEGPVRLAECTLGEGEVSDEATCESMATCPIGDPIHLVQRRIADCLKLVTLAELVGCAAKGAEVMASLDQ